jgi:hypothetical protein
MRAFAMENLRPGGKNRQGMLALPFHCILYLSLDFALVDLVINLLDVKKGTRKKPPVLSKFLSLKEKK